MLKCVFTKTFVGLYPFVFVFVLNSFIKSNEIMCLLNFLLNCFIPLRLAVMSHFLFVYSYLKLDLDLRVLTLETPSLQL